MPLPAFRTEIARYTAWSAVSAAAPPPRTASVLPSMNPTFWGGSSSFEEIRSGRRLVRSDCSATRAARFAERTEP